MYGIFDFLEPVSTGEISEDNGFNDGQFGRRMDIYEQEMPDIEKADIVMVGIPETRGAGILEKGLTGPDAIRKEFYQLYYWHKDVAIADIGNIKSGASISDSYAAVKTVVAELLRQNKTIVLLGGSHDITLAQYAAFKEINMLIEATCIDAAINLQHDSPIRSENFLLEMLTGEPNFIKHYNHIGFQSYFVHPGMLETIDKLRFDCFRLGMVKEDVEEMEPVLRNSHLLSFDISAIKYSDAPASTQCPNGLTGEEACMLTRFAGMSNNMKSFGIYGYSPKLDVNSLTAKQISQMLWYFIDGKSRGKKEARIGDTGQFNEYHGSFTEVETVFLQSKKTGRWWMQLPDKKFIACSYRDYVVASQNEIPERWLRAQERE